MGVFTRGFHHHAVLFYYKNRKRERAGSQVTKTLSALEVLMMYSGTPETALTKKTLQTLLDPIFSTVECAPNQQQYGRGINITIQHSPSGIS